MSSPRQPDESDTRPVLPEQNSFSNQGPVADYVFIPGYRTVSLLSQDSRSWTFQAVPRDAEDVRVAIVVSRGNDPDCQAWYRRVGDVLARLDHPSIPRCRHDVTLDGFPYLVLSWVLAEDVVSRGRRLGPMAPDEALKVLQAIAGGLEHAHQRQVVHGDLHPRRVGFTAEGRIGIMGFGEFPPPEGFVGNLRHLAPEQFAEGQPPGPQADVYALAQIAYFLLTGVLYFERPSSGEDSGKTHGPESLLGQARPDLPPATGLAIERALAPRPQDRFSTAGQFVRTLALALRLRQDDPDPAEQRPLRREIDPLLAVFIDPTASETAVNEAAEELNKYGGLEADDLAPLLANLPRLVDLIARPNDYVLRNFITVFGREAAAALGAPCVGPLREALEHSVNEYDLLQAMVRCGGTADVADVLLHHPGSGMRYSAAVALYQNGGPDEAVGRALRAGWADTAPNVRKEVARAYWFWVNNWSPGELFDRVDELLVPLLEAAARDEACHGAFQPREQLYGPSYPMVSALARLMAGGIPPHCCSPPGQAMAAYALRHFRPLLPDFRERLEQCARHHSEEMVRLTAAESLRVLQEPAGT